MKIFSIKIQIIKVKFFNFISYCQNFPTRPPPSWVSCHPTGRAHFCSGEKIGKFFLCRKTCRRAVCCVPVVSLFLVLSISLWWSPQYDLRCFWSVEQWWTQSFMTVFLFQLNSEFKSEENPGVIYAISMVWFKEWESFARARSEGKQHGLFY